jgi:hypothetical protein
MLSNTCRAVQAFVQPSLLRRGQRPLQRAAVAGGRLPGHDRPFEGAHRQQCVIDSELLLDHVYHRVPAERPVLRKYRIIEWFSSGGNFSRLRTARIEGYLAGNRDSCRQQAAEIHPLMGREHCAVFP